jgi:hypothetical protein
MNLVCFPHYTCGGLLCDILNNTFSTVGSNGGINSIMHGVGKIGDTNTVFVEFDACEFERTVTALNLSDNQWIGTHCWPANINTSIFNHVIVVTTTTYRSKIYRWLRAYHHYYTKSTAWLELSGMARIDKERETAKNYLIPFMPVMQPNVTNIEFAEIVETSAEFAALVVGSDVGKHMERWKSINTFLYDTNIWFSDPASRYYESELETTLQKHYAYQ